MTRSVALEPSGFVVAGVGGELQGDADLEVAAAGEVHRDRVERHDGARLGRRRPSPSRENRKK